MRLGRFVARLLPGRDGDDDRRSVEQTSEALGHVEAALDGTDETYDRLRCRLEACRREPTDDLEREIRDVTADFHDSWAEAETWAERGAEYGAELDRLRRVAGENRREYGGSTGRSIGIQVGSSRTRTWTSGRSPRNRSTATGSNLQPTPIGDGLRTTPTGDDLGTTSTHRLAAATSRSGA